MKSHRYLKKLSYDEKCKCIEYERLVREENDEFVASVIWENLMFHVQAAASSLVIDKSGEVARAIWVAAEDILYATRHYVIDYEIDIEGRTKAVILKRFVPERDEYEIIHKSEITYAIDSNPLKYVSVVDIDGEIWEG